MAIVKPSTTEPWDPTSEWNGLTQRRYSIGVDRGMLYIDSVGVPWSGLVSVNRKAGEGETRKRYIDGRRYRVDIAPTDYEASVEAFTYPDAFEQCLGHTRLAGGLVAHGQFGRSFDFCYRSLSGDGEGHREHYKIHFVWGCVAEESDYSYGTLNESPEASPFGFTLSAIPIDAAGLRPTSYFSLDSRDVSATTLRGLENSLYGRAGSTPTLPPIAEIRSYLSDAPSVYGFGIGDFGLVPFGS